MNRRVAVAMLSSVLICSCAGQPLSPAASPPAPRQSSSSTVYPIKVEVKEAAHRAVESRVRGHVVVNDQPKQFGADDTGPTPPETLAIALGSCVVSTIQFLAVQQHVKVSRIHVTVEGSVDFAKAMGMHTSKRSGFEALKVRVGFESDMTPERKAVFMKDVFDKGAAIDSIQNPTPVTYEVEP